METRFKYRLDRRSRRTTWVVDVVVALLFVGFHFILGAAYLPAWFLAFILCIIALYVLSIPRFVKLDSDALEVHCFVELTRIHIEDIEIIRPFEPAEFRKLVPLIGSYGFWGYYGYYFNFWEWNLYKVYATQRADLIVVEDIYEDTYIIGCEDAQQLITLAIEARDKKRQELLNPNQRELDESRTTVK